MPEPIYEYNLLYYSGTGKLEPPLGGGWRIYKSRVSHTSIGATVLWRRSIEDPKVEPESLEPRTLILDCVSGNSMFQGPYGPLRSKCDPCLDYESRYPNGKATFMEMLRECEAFLKSRVGSLPNGESDSDMIRGVRLHVSLHGYPSITKEQKDMVETLFHSLHVKFNK